MSDISAVDYLKTVRVFSSLSPEDWQLLNPPPEWVDIKGGETLIKQGEEDTDYFHLVSGRLRVFVKNRDGRQRSVATIKPGEGVGEMSLIAGEPRTATVRAKVDSRLIRFGGETFRRLMMRRPEAAMEVVRTVVQRLRDETHHTESRSTTSAIAILPVSEAVDGEAFADRLYASLRKCASACLINRLPNMTAIRNSPDVMDEVARRLGDEHHYVLFLADHRLSAWTRRCLLQADFVLLVGDVQASPEESQVEIELLRQPDRIMIERMELVLVHDSQFNLDAGMARWLGYRPSVADFHHVRTRETKDFDKLARCISGTSNHLVLGGGGARGFAHIGVIKALTEAGIPVDRVGGTSIGAVLGGQYAGMVDLAEWPKIVQRIFVKERSAGDYTLPFGSFLRGRRMHNAMIALFGERQIEDLPRRFFCVSSDLGRAKMVVHTQGSLWRAVRASASVPIIGPPLYQDNTALIDGGLFNNLPTDIMKKRFNGSIVAVDVSQGSPLVIDERWFDSTHSGWTLLLHKLNPFARPIALPHLWDILHRTLTLYSESVSVETRSLADIVIIPPVDGFSISQFRAYEKIIEIGYRHTIEFLEKSERAAGLRKSAG